MKYVQKKGFFQKYSPWRIQKSLIFLLHKIQEIQALVFLPFKIKQIYGPTKIEYGTNELIVLCVVKNGEYFIKPFIEHYFALGIKHIVFLDNGSTDHTIPIAKKYNNVTVLQTNLYFKKYHNAMRRYLIKTFSKNRWSLYADIDEFFYYPFYNNLSLNSFLEYLNYKKYTTVVSQMLDVFPRKELRRKKIRSTSLNREDYVYYDLSGIQKSDYLEMLYELRTSGRFRFNFDQIICGLSFDKKCSAILENKNIKAYSGGIFKRLFGYDRWLTKCSLNFYGRNANPLIFNHYSYGSIADFSCVLFHYLFSEQFYGKVAQISTNKNYGDSGFYETVFNFLGKRDYLKIKQKTSKKLKTVNQLIDDDFLVVSTDYLDWVKTHKK